MKEGEIDSRIKPLAKETKKKGSLFGKDKMEMQLRKINNIDDNRFEPSYSKSANYCICQYSYKLFFSCKNEERNEQEARKLHVYYSNRL